MKGNRKQQQPSPMSRSTATAISLPSSPKKSPPIVESVSTSESTPPSIDQIENNDNKNTATPTKPQKRILFFTPTKSHEQKKRLQQEQQQPVSASSAYTTPEQTHTSIPQQIKTPGSTGSSNSRNTLLSSRQLSSGRSCGGGRRRYQQPLSGLSRLSPHRRQRQQPPLSSGRRGTRNLNPLSRISDNFSPQSPSFSSRGGASPIAFEFPAVSDSSFSDNSSASGSIKEPFTEQVSRLDELLATPSQHLGELAITQLAKDDKVEDDNLDAEMEDLESSRRMLAEELSRVDISLLGFDTAGMSTTPEIISGNNGSYNNNNNNNDNSKTYHDGKNTATPSLSFSKCDVHVNNNDGTDWVPLLAVDEKFPPNFSPTVRSPQPNSNSNLVLVNNNVTPTGRNVDFDRKMSPLVPSTVIDVTRKPYTKYTSLNTPPRNSNKSALRSIDNRKISPVSNSSERCKLENNSRSLVRRRTAVSSSDRLIIVKDMKKQETEKLGETICDSSNKTRDNKFSVTTKNTGSDDKNGSFISPRGGVENYEMGRLKIIGDKLGVDMENVTETNFMIDRSEIISVRNHVGNDSKQFQVGEEGAGRRHSLQSRNDVENIFLNQNCTAELFQIIEKEMHDVHGTKNDPKDLSATSSVINNDVESSKFTTTQKSPPGRLHIVQKARGDDDEKKPYSPNINITRTHIMDTSTSLSSLVVDRGCGKENFDSSSASSSSNQSSFQSFVSFAEHFSNQRRSYRIECTPGPRQRVPKITPERRTLFLTEGATEHNKRNNDDLLITPTRNQDLSYSSPLSSATTKSASQSILGLSPIRSSQSTERVSQATPEPPRLLEADRASSPTITPNNTDASTISNEAKQSKSRSSSILVSILPDDSEDDEVLFVVDSPHPIPCGTDCEAPKNNYGEVPQSEMFTMSHSRENSNHEEMSYSKNRILRPSQKCKRIFFFLAILVFLIGLSLVLGTIFLASGEKTAVPTKSVATMPSGSPSTPSASEVFSTTNNNQSSDPASVTGSAIFTTVDAISFSIPYNIFISDGVTDFVPESDYVPGLISSMNALTSDVLLNILKRRKLKDGRRKVTSVILPTKVNAIFDVACEKYIMNSLCQQIVSEISLVDANDTWEEFRDTTKLAIEIGRLQYHLQQFDPNSPVEIIDSRWIPS